MMISDCRSYEKDWSTHFVIEYITWENSWKTFIWKDWNEKNELKKVFKNQFIDRWDLPQSFDKKSDDEICQELKGQFLVRALILTA